MTNLAEIDFDTNDNLICELEQDDLTYFADGQKVIDFLSMVNNHQYKSVRLRKNSLVLISEDEEIVIKNIAKFAQKGYLNRLPKLTPRIKKAIANYNRMEAIHKRNSNPHKGRKKVIATGMVLAMLCLAPTLYHASKLNDVSQESNEDIDFDDLEIKEIDDTNKIQEVYDVNAVSENLNFPGDTLNDMTELPENIIVSEPNEVLEEAQDGEIVYLNYSLSSDDEKREHAYTNYYPIVERYAPKWGISPNLVMAMLTQESGGYEKNLMRIEFDKWLDDVIKVYNFNDNEYNYFVLTDNPEKYAGRGITCITREDLNNPITNISIACVILRKSAEYMDYHVLAGVQCYNLGQGNMDIVIAATEEATGQTRDEILSDQENVSFYDYTYVVDVGDPEYLSNVFAFLSNYGDTITFKHFNDNGEIVEENITINSNSQGRGYH